MKNVIGIMDLNENETHIRTLTSKRPVATLPIAGRYRLIDFALSSMVNSGIIKIGLMLPAKSRSIVDHLRSGKDWDLARRHDGLFYLPALKEKKDTRNGNLQSFYSYLNFVKKSDQEYVLISGSRFLYNIDFRTVLRFHQNTGADITMIYHVENKETSAPATILKTSENGLVNDIIDSSSTYENAKVFMGIYIMSTKKYEELVSNAYERGGRDFLIDAILRNQDNLNIYAFQHEGYVSEINSTISYYKTNMDLLKPEIWEELFMSDNPIYTRVRDEAPVQYKKQAKAVNSLVANGCVIEGSVENSILFRGVKIGKGVQVKNSVIMQNCDLQEDSLIENVICDKNVVVTDGKWLKGAENYPLIIEKNTVI